MSLKLEGSDLNRFEQKFVVVQSCWLWGAAIDAHGYGRFSVAGRMKLAHRLSYETYIGPIPEGLDLDHLCRVRHCVNPQHLEPVTRSENLFRSPLMGLASLSKTHCPRGHEYSGDNVRVTSSGARACRGCDRARWDAEKYNPKVDCDFCGKQIRRNNMKKHISVMHPEIAKGLGL